MRLILWKWRCCAETIVDEDHHTKSHLVMLKSLVFTERLDSTLDGA